jgi:excisionase family DNA binding protein
MLPADPLLPLPGHLLEVSHVAYRLSLSEDYVRRLIRAKKIPVIRLGARYRIDPLDLQAFIEAQRVNGNGNGKDA